MAGVQLFLDTASLVELRKYLAWGIIDGVTTNQKIFSLEKNCSFEQRVREICAMVEGPVSVETTSHQYEELVEEGRYFHSLCWKRSRKC